MVARQGFSPAQLTYWSNNVQGLNTPEECSHLHRRLWTAKASVAFLQETHLRSGDAPKLENQRFPLGFYANHTDAKKAGVAILFAHTTPFQCTKTLADPNGRYLFLKGTISDRVYTFACLYGPNKKHTFFSRTLAKLERFREGLLVAAGDLKIPMEPHIDTSRGQSTIPTHCLRATILTQIGARGLLEGIPPRRSRLYLLLSGPRTLQSYRLHIHGPGISKPTA
ncbi:Hypothetical predicted protein [Pelobates cultripes]|uniref:Uncharacterized protein n=1 Tax=Pelobates cultripes TaxID=61616 RepID=A0AAD1S611_PELCU|nr:Hypothetical predicted protein [Pelobates cultripes]